MSDAEVVRSRVLWQDRLPWLILLRAFRPAVSMRMLLYAAAGLALTIAGWRLCWMMLVGSDDGLFKHLAPYGSTDATGTVWPAWPWHEQFSQFGNEGVFPDWSSYGELGAIASRVAASIWQLTLPFQFMFREDIGLRGLMYSILCGLWALAVWSLVGGIMTRTVALQLTRQETIPWGQAHNFAVRHWLDYFTAPLYPLLGVLLATLPVMVLGLIAQFNIGAYLAAILWPLVLLAGLFMALLLLGLFFGWPLMWSTVSVEGNDAFDALSRSYAYVYQRPLHYLFYGLVAAVLGTLGYVLVHFFAEAVIQLAAWAASWGATNERMKSLLNPGYSYATVIIVGFNGLVRLIAAGFAISYLWSATTAIYLLLRRDVDAAEMDEVQLEQDERFGLPPLATDERGVPGAADVPASSPDKPLSEDE